MSDLIERLNGAIAKSKSDNGDMMYLGQADPILVDSLAELTRLRGEVERLRGAGQFLVDRIDELDWCDWDRHTNDWNGHVDPALDRFRSTLQDAR